MAKEKTLKLGAEARLTLKDNIVEKKRIKKSYRLPEIDLELRKKRTSLEASLMQKAGRAGIPVPRILNINKENFAIEMDFINGKLIDTVINEKLAKILGKEIALMHNSDIIHGDLTTSNIIVKSPKPKAHSPKPIIYFIDFGLGEFSNSVEKKAVDLRVLKEAIRANHPKKAEKLMKEILKAYEKNALNGKEVLKRLEEVEKRGRYKER